MSNSVAADVPYLHLLLLDLGLHLKSGRVAVEQVHNEHEDEDQENGEKVYQGDSIMNFRVDQSNIEEMNIEEAAMIS